MVLERKKTYFTVSNQALRDDRSVNSFTFSLDTCNCSRQMDLLHLFCVYYFVFRWNLAFCFEWSFVCVCFFQFDCLFHLPFFLQTLFTAHTYRKTFDKPKNQFTTKSLEREISKIIHCVDAFQILVANTTFISFKKLPS